MERRSRGKEMRLLFYERGRFLVPDLYFPTNMAFVKCRSPVGNIYSLELDPAMGRVSRTSINALTMLVLRE